jgi:hypothetical protein
MLTQMFRLQESSVGSSPGSSCSANGHRKTAFRVQKEASVADELAFHENFGAKREQVTGDHHVKPFTTQGGKV